MSVEVKGLSKVFGRVVKALDNVSFTVEEGSFLTLLGPSGCGKSTTLRCIAGVELPEEGVIAIGDKVVLDSKNNIWVPPYARNISMVFQSYALWPHMTVAENIAYGLRVRHYPNDEVKKRVKEVLQLIKLEGFEKRYPSELSGGQQQRVAVGRAIAYKPDVLLLDEPLSNLDEKLRQGMRLEIKELQKRLGITTIYVTHSKEEALAMADQIIVMNLGRVVGAGGPTDIYLRPPNPFIADFVGYSNRLAGEVEKRDGDMVIVVTEEGISIVSATSPDIAVGDSVELFIAPKDVEVFRPGTKPTGENLSVWEVQVVSCGFQGEYTDYSLLTGDKILSARSPARPIATLGERVCIGVNPSACRIFKAEA